MRTLYAYYTQWCHYYVVFMSLLCHFYVTIMSLSNFVIYWNIIKYFRFMSYVTIFCYSSYSLYSFSMFFKWKLNDFFTFSANILQFSKKPELYRDIHFEKDKYSSDIWFPPVNAPKSVNIHQFCKNSTSQRTSIKKKCLSLQADIVIVRWTIIHIKIWPVSP